MSDYSISEVAKEEEAANNQHPSGNYFLPTLFYDADEAVVGRQLRLKVNFRTDLSGRKSLSVIIQSIY